jgi:predicted flap endonuclease-1-like 5' DNA nuclease
VVSDRVGSFDDVDMPDVDLATEAKEIAGRFAPADMPPVEVEPLEALPAVTSFFLDDLPEGAVVVRCPQDLSAVRGIGQLYEQRLYRAGVGTYWMLAELSDEMLNDILEAQAFQDVDLDAIRASAREWMEKTNSSGRVWDATEPDDFEVLEGIGDVYEGRLYDAGICTYASLAALTEAELAEICRAPSFRTPDYAGWIATAQRLSAQAEG